MDADHRVRSLICINQSSGRLRMAVEDIDRRATVVHAACPATVARMERLAMAEVEDERRAVAVTSEVVAVEVDMRAEVVAVVTAPVEAGAATEAEDTARVYEL